MGYLQQLQLLLNKNKIFKMSRSNNNNNERRINWCLKHKIRHFAATISPAPKDLDNIESIREALRYYKYIGAKKVCIQPKYMGSYVDVELTKNIKETRFFSRRGYLITYLDREKLIKAVQPLHDNIFKYNSEVNKNLNKILVQAELLPWNVMGAKMIEKEFTTYATLIQNHIDDLDDMNFFSTIFQLRQDKRYAKFEEMYSYLLSDYANNEEYSNLIKSEKIKLADKTMSQFFKQHEVRQYKALYHCPNIQPNVQKSLDVFNEQLDIYNYSSDEYELKPFNILKYYYVDGSYKVNDSNIEGFDLVSNDDQLVVSFEENDFDLCVNLVEDYYAALILNDNEGVMIKPEQVFIEGAPHAMKVRNNNYLMLIYGIDYQTNYNRYWMKRRISAKMSLQKHQWAISQQLLHLKEEEILNLSDKYVSLVTQRVLSEEKEVELDSVL